MYVVIEYSTDMQLAEKVLSKVMFNMWKVKVKALMSFIKGTYTDDELVDTEHGFIAYEEGTVSQCKENIAKLNKKLIDQDLKDVLISQKIKDRIFNKFAFRTKQTRMEGKSALAILNQAGILMTWKTQNGKPY